MKLTNVFEAITTMSRVQKSYFEVRCNVKSDSKVYDFRNGNLEELYKFFIGLDNKSIDSFYALINDAETVYLFELYFCTDRKTEDHEPIYDLSMSYHDLENGIIELPFWDGDPKIPTCRNMASMIISATWRLMFK